MGSGRLGFSANPQLSTNLVSLYQLPFEWGYSCYLIELEPAQKYEISELKNRDVQVLNSTAIASGYAGLIGR